MRRRLLALGMILPTIVLAQKPLVLTKPEVEYSEPFTQISGVRELRDGRVIVADVRDKTLQLLDLKSGSSSKIGREGQGPGEYGLPFRLVALPGDSSALYDVANSRYLMIHPDGKTGKDFRLEAAGSAAAPAPGGGAAGGRVGGGPPGEAGRGGRGGPMVTLGGGRGGMMTITPPRATDARGNVYYEGPPISMGPNGEPVSADSAAVLRFDRSSNRVDTVAWVRLAKANVEASGGQNNMRIMIGGANPLVPRDDWAALPDGRVAVLRSPEYRLDLYSNARNRVQGSPIAYDRIRVDDAVKKDVEEARKRAQANGIRMMVTDGRGGQPQRSVSVGGGGGDVQLPPLTGWPEFVPPFLSNTVQSRGNGEVWVLRTSKPGDSVPVYDVFDASGKIIGKVALPAKSRLAGFGANTVYVIRLDEDDLQYLQRYRLPADGKLIG